MAQGRKRSKGGSGRASEPDIGDRAPVPRQVRETVKALEALEGNAGDVLGIGEAEVDRDPGPPIFHGAKAAPADEIAADPAELNESEGEPRVYAVRTRCGSST